MTARRGGPLVVAAVLAVVATLMLLLGTPARAADGGRLLVGRHAQGPFAESLSTPLFSARRFVPRDHVTRTFWVRNGSTDPARTAVAVLRHGAGNDFDDALSFDLQVGRPGRTTSHAVGGPHCTTVSGPALAPGAVQPVRVSMRVADLAGQTGSGLVAPVEVEVTLVQSTRSGPIDVCGEQAALTGEDADTGTDEERPGGANGRARCDHDVVVTTTGAPTCVPTAVAAGAGRHEAGAVPGARDPIGVAGGALLLLGGGAVLMLWSDRRRRRTTPEPATP